MDNQRPATNPEAPAAKNGSRAESLLSTADCGQLISFALQAEYLFKQSEDDLEAADAVWVDTRRLTIENNPRALRAQRECQVLRQRYLSIKGQRIQPNLSPELKDLQENMEKANAHQAGICKSVLESNPEFLSVSVKREEVRSICRELREEMLQARQAVLRVLEENFNIGAAWTDIETLLEADLRQKAMETGLQLAEAQKRHERSLTDISQCLGSLLPAKPKRGQNYGRPRPAANRRQRRPADRKGKVGR